MEKSDKTKEFFVYKNQTQLGEARNSVEVMPLPSVVKI
jgi:hypothetical protein